jgi:hypothetical protein
MGSLCGFFASAANAQRAASAMYQFAAGRLFIGDNSPQG